MKTAIEVEKSRMRALYFIAMIHREFGTTTRTVGKMDPTDVVSSKGFLLFQHPLLGDIHYEVKYNESYGIECIEMSRAAMDDDEQRCGNCGRPTIDDAEAVRDSKRNLYWCCDCKAGGNEEDSADPVTDRAIEEEERGFADFNERIISYGCGAGQREVFSPELCKIFDWALSEPSTRLSKKRFKPTAPDYDCVY